MYQTYIVKLLRKKDNVVSTFVKKLKQQGRGSKRRINSKHHWRARVRAYSRALLHFLPVHAQPPTHPPPCRKINCSSSGTIPWT